MGIELMQVDTIISKHGTDRRALTEVLLDIQDEFHYLPQQALERIAEKMQVPAIQVYQVARFYKAFSLKPRGKHLISVCAGTACQVQQGTSLVEKVGQLLDIAPGETTEDGEFTLETTNCPGSCPVGPVLIVDGIYHNRVSVNQVEQIIPARAGAQGGNAS
jgi:NADH-quinone oxidoreductase subunit E